MIPAIPANEKTRFGGFSFIVFFSIDQNQVNLLIYFVIVGIIIVINKID